MCAVLGDVSCRPSPQAYVCLLSLYVLGILRCLQHRKPFRSCSGIETFALSLPLGCLRGCVWRDIERWRTLAFEILFAQIPGTSGEKPPTVNSCSCWRDRDCNGGGGVFGVGGNHILCAVSLSALDG